MNSSFNSECTIALLYSMHIGIVENKKHLRTCADRQGGEKTYIVQIDPRKSKI